MLLCLHGLNLYLYNFKDEDQSPFELLRDLVIIDKNSTLNIEISEETRHFIIEGISKIENFKIIKNEPGIINELR
jgi:hypothetical protein